MAESTEVSHAETKPGETRAIVLAGLVLAAFVAIAWLIRAPGIGPANDDAVYLFLSRAIKAGTYRNDFLLVPTFHGQYPPGWPLVIALVTTLVGGEQVTAIVLVSIASVAGGFALVFDLVRERVGATRALVVLVLLAANPFFLGIASMPLSDGFFFFLAMLAIWALQRSSARSDRWAYLALTAAAGSFAVRTAGVAVLGAVVLTFVGRRRWRLAFGAAVVAATVVGGWLAWSAAVDTRQAGRSYLAEFAPGSLVPSGLGQVASDVTTLHKVLGFPRVEGTSVENLAFVGLFLGLALVSAARLWREYRPVVWMTLLYLGLLVVYPWGLPRYFLPLLPGLLLMSVIGIDRLGRSLAPRWQWGLLLGFAAVLLPRSLGGVRSELTTMAQCDRRDPIGSAHCWGPRERAFLATAQWARALPDSVIVATPHEASFGYYSGKRVAAFDPETPPARIGLLVDQGADLFVVERRPPRADGVRRADPTLSTVCDRLDLERQVMGITHVFRLSGSSNTRNAVCSLLKDGRW
mgnify:CR=1 FL=1